VGFRMQSGGSKKLAILAAYAIGVFAISGGLLHLELTEWWFSLALPPIFYHCLRREKSIFRPMLGIVLAVGISHYYIKYADSLLEDFKEFFFIWGSIWALCEAISYEIRRRDKVNQLLREGEDRYRRLF